MMVLLEVGCWKLKVVKVCCLKKKLGAADGERSKNATEAFVQKKSD
jgi:hypothetical protein